MTPDRIHNTVLVELARTDRAVFQQLMQELDPHPMQRGAVLGPARSLSDYAYFVDSGVISLVAHTQAGHSVEVAVVGDMPPGWSLREESHPHEPESANRVLWRLAVPAGGETVLTYRVRVSN